MSNAPGGLDMRPEWLVGFVEATPDSPWWQRRLLRRGYAHCWAARCIGRHGPGLWLWVEWLPDCVVVGVASTLTVETHARAAFDVVRWRQDLGREGAPRRPIAALHHCALLVSHAVGLRPRPFPTPWWVRCALLKRGGEAMVRPEQPEPRP